MYKQTIARLELVRSCALQTVLTTGLAVALSVVMTQSASASILGDTVHGEMVFKDFPGLGNMFDPTPKPGCPECTVPPFPDSSGIQPNAVVTDADTTFPEFIFVDVGFLDVTVDIDESTIDVAVVNTTGTPPTAAPFGWEIRITGMEWVGPLPGFLTDASVIDDTLFPGLTASVIDAGTGILIDFPGRGSSTDQAVLDAYIANDSLTATVSFAAEHIPEPASAALWLIAMTGCAVVRRRRR